MAKKRFGLEFSAIAELAEKYEKLGGDLQEVTTKALEFIPDKVNPDLSKAISQHRRTGKTAASLARDQKVAWQGTVASIAVGFQLSNGGFPSIFLMYGTARHAPSNQYGGPYGGSIQTIQDKRLYDAIYGNRTQKAITEEQQKIFADEIAKIINGG